MSAADPASLRVMTYNVHGCVGLDWQRSEKRIADVIASFQPDIVGLQELDMARKRSAGVDQARLIAMELGFHHLFHPAFIREEEHYGDAILSRWPMVIRRVGELPSKKAFPFPETRGALWVKIQTPLGGVHVMNTHFGIGPGERMEQAEALSGSEWIGAVPEKEPLIVLGDFNSLPGSRPYRILSSILRDAKRVQGKRSQSTFPTFLPLLHLDHIFVNRMCSVQGVEVGKGRAVWKASDHFPLIALIGLHCHTRGVPAQNDLSA